MARHPANAAGLAELQIVMRMPTRQEHMLADVSGEFDSRMQPGGAWLLGERVQAVRPGRQPTPLPAARKAYDLLQPVCGGCRASGERFRSTSVERWLPGSSRRPCGRNPRPVGGGMGSARRDRCGRPVVLADVTDRQLRSLWRSAVRLPDLSGTRGGGSSKEDEPRAWSGEGAQLRPRRPRGRPRR